MEAVSRPPSTSQTFRVGDRVRVVDHLKHRRSTSRTVWTIDAEDTNQTPVQDHFSATRARSGTWRRRSLCPRQPSQADRLAIRNHRGRAPTSIEQQSPRDMGGGR